MQLGQGLYQQQVQKLIMTPELRQAITVLQYSATELMDYLHQEIIDNPVFEINEKNFEKYETFYNSYFKGIKTNYISDESWSIWDTIATPSGTLEDFLLEQARFLDLNKEVFDILKYLVGCLDDYGYLTISLEEIAEELKVSISKVEEALTILHSLEPVGVGARSLQENLLIQLARLESVDTLAVEIVKNHLKELGERKFNKIAQQFKISVHEVQQIFDFIKTLNPKPTVDFNNINNPKYIIPDVLIQIEEGEFVVLINEKITPKLKINKDYQQYIQIPNSDEISKYLSDKLNSANWLIKSIEQRKNTIYKVTKAIFKHQSTFIKDQRLKPLTLKEIAKDVGVHESTVSRAINQKYVQTPAGTFELKYFFTTGITTSDGLDISSENVKQEILQQIEIENKRKPLSDQKLTDILNKKGINISRRTVAKYRDELGIQSSSGRRRYD